MKLEIKTFLSGLCLVSLTSACVIAKEEVVDGLVLFDGSSLDAWRSFKQPEVGPNWVIQDGALVCTGGGADLITREEFDNFSLEFEWKVSAGANSGVMYHVTEAEGETYISGPEYQVLDNATLGESGDLRTSASSNYALHAPYEDYTRPVGEWNEGRIDVDGNSVRHYLNGSNSVHFSQWTPSWEALVKDSKFGAWPAYGRSRTGHIVLQDHGGGVSYRNIRVTRLH